MGGKGSSGPSYDPALGSDYLNRYPDVYAAQMDPWEHYNNHGKAEGRTWGVDYGSLFPEFSMPDMSSMYDDMPSYEDQLADQQRIQGENDRDSLYGSYMDAASTATDYINSEISQEQANAALLGVDYTMDDEIKSQRISDYFATLWGEGQQSQLEALMGTWGNPTGFTGFTVQRGDGSKYASREGSEETVGATTGQKPIVSPLLDEEDSLESSSILGV